MQQLNVHRVFCITLVKDFCNFTIIIITALLKTKRKKWAKNCHSSLFYDWGALYVAGVSLLSPCLPCHNGQWTLTCKSDWGPTIMSATRHWLSKDSPGWAINIPKASYSTSYINNHTAHTSPVLPVQKVLLVWTCLICTPLQSGYRYYLHFLNEKMKKYFIKANSRQMTESEFKAGKFQCMRFSH